MARKKILVIGDGDVMLAILDKHLLFPLGFGVYKALKDQTGLT